MREASFTHLTHGVCGLSGRQRDPTDGMIARTLALTLNSHFMALTCQCKVNSVRRERHTFSHLDLLVTPTEFLMVSFVDHPEGPSCSRHYIKRSSFYELSPF